VINGKKHWITGGGVSRLHLVFARVFDEEGHEEGIAGFIALRDETRGLKIGRREPAMGLRGIPEAEILFEDMEVTADALVLPPRGLRKGFADLMNAYNGQRIGAATVALGLAEGAYELGLGYSKEREQFGLPDRGGGQQGSAPSVPRLLADNASPDGGQARRHPDHAPAA